jgi:hypothetical protein
MKIGVRAVVFIIISLVFSSGFASQDRRQDWWSLHLEKTRSLRGDLAASGNADQRVLSLLDREIRGAESILALYDKAIADGDSLVQASVNFNPDEIRSSVTSMVSPMSSLRMIRLLVSAGEGTVKAHKTVSLVREKLAAMLSESFTADSGELLEMFLARDVSAMEWKRLGHELFLESLVKGIDAFRKKAIDDVTADIISCEAAKGKLTRGKLDSLILERAERCLSAAGFVPESFADEAALEKCPAWRGISGRLSHDICAYKAIMKFLPDGKSISPARVRFYHENPAAMDSLALTPPGILSFERKDGAAASYDPRGGTLMIPQLPDMKRIYDEIDSLRKRALQRIREKGDADYVRQVTAEMEKAIAANTSRCDSAFLYEEKRVEKAGYSGDRIPNSDEFGKARGVFRENLKLAREYRIRSGDFLRLVSDGRRRSGAELSAIHEYSLNRGTFYAGFAAGFFAEAVPLAAHGNRLHHENLMSGGARLDLLFLFLREYCGLDREASLFMNAGEIREAKGRSLEYSRRLAGSRHAIGLSCARYDSDYRASQRNRAGGEDRVKSLSAQYEVEEVARALRDYSSTLKGFTYTGEALNRYRAEYDLRIEEARRGLMSPVMKRILAENSLAPMVSDFSPKKIRAEEAARNFCLGRFRTLSARLKSLVAWHEKSGVAVKDYPAADELAALESSSGGHPSIEVADWRMDGSNFRLVDLKAAAMIKSALEKKLWHEPEASLTERRSLSSGGVCLSLSMPAGWSQTTRPAGGDKSGIMGSFSSADEAAFITLVKIPLENRRIDQVSRDWLSGKGSRFVKKQWAKRDSTEYFHVLARNGEKGLCECYVLEHGGCAFILQGETSRERYNLFRNRLEAVFNSMEF